MRGRRGNSGARRRAACLDQSSTQRLEEALGQRGLGAASEGAGQEQGRLLLDGRVLVVHHGQDVLGQVLQGGLQSQMGSA